MKQLSNLSKIRLILKKCQPSIATISNNFKPIIKNNDIQEIIDVFSQFF